MSVRMLRLRRLGGSDCLRTCAWSACPYVSAWNGTLPVQHFVQDAAERVDVDAMIGGFAARLLRGHVLGGAEDHAALRQSIAGAGATTEPLPASIVVIFAMPKSRIFTKSLLPSLSTGRCFPVSGRGGRARF